MATKKLSDTKLKREKTKDDLKKQQEEKLKKSIYTVSTPRDYVQKSSYTDIYSQKKKVTPGKAAPKKTPGATSTTNVSPMKGLLKSSASTTSFDRKSIKDTKTINSARNEPKKLPFSNVTVNSPIVKRKLDLNSTSKLKTSVESKEVTRPASKYGKEVRSKEVRNVTKEVSKVTKEVDKCFKKDQDTKERQRTKTRTLDESEVKILTPDAVDNNAEMLKLTKKLEAKPKAFYVELEETHKIVFQKGKEKSSDEEVSYEDDFESYESDFDSYHSEVSEKSEKSEPSDSEVSETSKHEANENVVGTNLKEGKDEEKMLDSGSYDLRDRSAKSKPVLMENIQEGNEDDKRVSLTDEGFQEMSSSSAVSSMKTIETLDRPIFLDFKKAKQNKLKRLFNERLKQRAKDLLPMISLHEMSYSLFEMQPISYDLYMATYGKNNYTQIGVQTFDDGITQEVQTDDILVLNKWTQYPVEFSKSDISYTKEESRKYSKNTEDYFNKFTFLLNQNSDCKLEGQIQVDENYKTNPLRIYFEQKDGAGGDEMLPYEIYKSKLKTNDYNRHKLSKFLKKCESRLSFHLNKNTGSTDLTGLTKTSKLPFSKGHITISPRLINNEKYLFLKYSVIVNIFLSDTKSNLVMTEHKKAQGIECKKSLICLWDLSVARDPLKVLSAIDSVTIGRFKGNTEGIFVGALEDSSIHLWDLSEDPTYYIDVATPEKSPELKEVKEEGLTKTEHHRQWNLENSNVGYPQFDPMPPLQSCAYTNSAVNMDSTDLDSITGLVITSETANLDSAKKLIGQVISLQSVGILIIWSIIQEKRPSTDIGKAYWSKMKLEKAQTINLNEHIDLSIKDSQEIHSNFNLNSAKRRMNMKKIEKCSSVKFSRPKTPAVTKYDFDIDRPSSAASMRKKVLPVEINTPESWETGLICNDLKVIHYNNMNCFLVAKNCGEVLCCKKCLGVMRVDRFCVSNDMSSVTSIEVSSQSRAQFLAASDNGTVNLCSLLDNRVLLTLDCRNIPPSLEVGGRCQSDHKGRYVGTVVSRSASNDSVPCNKISISSVHWSRVNPCCIHIHMHSGAVVTFDLTRSDINATHLATDVAKRCSISDDAFVILTPDGEVQMHRLTDDQKTKEYVNIFDKYVSLL